MRRIALTPLADLVFILLVFFILQTSFAENFQISHRIPGSSGTTAGPAVHLKLQLFPEGQVWIDNRSVGATKIREYLLTRRVKQDTSVTIEVHKSSSLQSLVETLDQLYAVDLKSIRIISAEGDL